MFIFRNRRPPSRAPLLNDLSNIKDQYKNMYLKFLNGQETYPGIQNGGQKSLENQILETCTVDLIPHFLKCMCPTIKMCAREHD